VTVINVLSIVLMIAGFFGLAVLTMNV